MLTSLFSLGLLACSPDPEDSGPADTGAEIDVLSFYIYDPFTADSAPVEGVTVAFDTTDGERLEAVSDADGLAAVELELDRFASAIAHADGRSFAGVTAAAVIPSFTPGEALALPSWSLSSPTAAQAGAGASWLTISGSLLNKAGDDDAVFASATTGQGYVHVQDGPTSYELTVPAGQDFALVALDYEADANWGDDRVYEHDFKSWVVIEQPALSGDTTIDVDFADAVVPHTVVGSVRAPSDATLSTRGVMFIEVFAGGAFTGFSPSTAPGADGMSYDFRLEYVDVDSPSPTSYTWIRGPDGSESALWWVGGIPGEGAQDLGLLTPPRRNVPTGDGPFDWDQPFSWTPSRGGDNTLVFFADPGQIGWIATGPDDTDFALPPLPSTSTRLASGQITGFIGAFGDRDEDGYPELQATDAPFALTSPL